MDNVIKKIQDDYNIIARDFSQKRGFLWSEIKYFLKYVKRGNKVLDVGCGNGRLYPELKDKKVSYLGIDFSQELLKIAGKNHPQAEFLKVDISQVKDWQKVKGLYDVVFCTAVLHHFPTLKLQLFVLKQINKRLKKDGVLVLSVWNLWQEKFLGLHLKQILWKIAKGFRLRWLLVPFGVSDGKKTIYKVNRFLYAFSRKELTKLFKKTGFEIIEEKIGKNLCFMAKKC